MLVVALGSVKRACALVNRDSGSLLAAKAVTIMQAAEEVNAGSHDQKFPLSVW